MTKQREKERVRERERERETSVFNSMGRAFFFFSYRSMKKLIMFLSYSLKLKNDEESLEYFKAVAALNSPERL